MMQKIITTIVLCVATISWTMDKKDDGKQVDIAKLREQCRKEILEDALQSLLAENNEIFLFFGGESYWINKDKGDKGSELIFYNINKASKKNSNKR